MTINRQKAKGRRESGAFVPLPCSVLNHPNFVALTPKAIKLLMDLLSQIRFKSGGPIKNGDLCATASMMMKRGWRSKETLEEALKELIHYGFIKLTRQGGRHQASLYAVTWWAVNEGGGKLDCGETRAPSSEWAMEKPKWQPKSKRKKKSVPRYACKGAPTGGAHDPQLKVVQT